ncbi:MAG TPA: acyl-CoA dehydratase activase [Syntrophales bacterium]|nr:acyl-CoA dehydratase activase [Syntrophales bacterium]HOM07084.1 acyl-CoA dehydratase activase [Syntrophales bacterium]HON98879.1 acyl-CoA dehydratase activase [Syntrophales bacterium]HPC00343.1 acyl-CoA dehydratase activase [Syntrophales bacterium]HPQ06547.1 acyl-CoA dehydratase activase [Syntrophales bacterium]
MITAGVDIGSITAKAAVLKEGEVLAVSVGFTGYNAAQAGMKVLAEALAEAGVAMEGVDAVAATGYGRRSLPVAGTIVTEITCHAAGVHLLHPRIRTLVDIGGQDSKAILMGDDGKVKNFVMNDKCAAGTGRFLEVMARALEVDLDSFGELSQRAERAARISNLCTVFAESEVISLIAAGEERENIIAGIHEAIGSRVFAMINRLGYKEPIMMTGGVAKNKGVVAALERQLGCPIEISPYAQCMGAIGAAVVAREK